MEVCQGGVSNGGQIRNIYIWKSAREKCQMVGKLVIDIWKSAREKYQMVGKLVIDIWKSAREKHQIWWAHW